MRFKKKTDANQTEIVSQLRDIPGVSVETDHDDILVGYKGQTFWFELKTKKPSASALRESQKKLLANYKGHYEVVWTLDQILKSISILK